jgi:hypothetical protein
MFRHVAENINQTQELAKERINEFLKTHGYVLHLDQHHTKGIETRIFQWINTEKNHGVQLIWDSKEDWYDLGEFVEISNLNYRLAEEVKIFPFHRTKWLNRNKYRIKYVDSIVEQIKTKIPA